MKEIDEVAVKGISDKIIRSNRSGLCCYKARNVNKRSRYSNIL